MGNELLAQPRAPRWIVCGNELRSVFEGDVDCPEGAPSPWDSCLDCRLLEAVDDDRERGCGEVEAAASASLAPKIAIAIRRPELIIELL